MALKYDIQKKEVQPQSLYKQACYQYNEQRKSIHSNMFQ